MNNKYSEHFLICNFYAKGYFGMQKVKRRGQLENFHQIMKDLVWVLGLLEKWNSWHGLDLSGCGCVKPVLGLYYLCNYPF